MLLSIILIAVGVVDLLIGIDAIRCEREHWSVEIDFLAAGACITAGILGLIS